MSDYASLHVWRKAHQLALDIYQLSARLPRSETYGLQAQLRRAAVSIPSNLAEGTGRTTRRDFARFVSIAIGSANELHYQLLLTKELGYVDTIVVDDARARAAEVRRMLSSLRNRLVDPIAN